MSIRSKYGCCQARLGKQQSWLALQTDRRCLEAISYPRICPTIHTRKLKKLKKNHSHDLYNMKHGQSNSGRTSTSTKSVSSLPFSQESEATKRGVDHNLPHLSPIASPPSPPPPPTTTHDTVAHKALALTPTHHPPSSQNCGKLWMQHKPER